MRTRAGATASQGAGAERKAAEVKKAEEAAVVTFEKIPAQAQVKVDGLVMISKEISLNAGRHTVTATSPGYQPWQAMMQLHEGEKRTVKIKLEKVVVTKKERKSGRIKRRSKATAKKPKVRRPKPKSDSLLID